MLRVAASLLVLATAAVAVEDDEILESGLSFIDMRIGAIAAPGPSEVAFTYTPVFGAAFDGTMELSGSRGTGGSIGFVGGRLDPAGMVFGVEIVFANTRQEVEGFTINGVSVTPDPRTAELDTRTVGGNALAGFGLQCGRRCHLELLGVAGGGAFQQDLVDPTDHLDLQAAGGRYWNLGVRAGAYAAIRRLVLGAAVDWTHYRSRTATDWAAGEQEQTTTWEGLGGRIEAGWRF